MYKNGKGVLKDMTKAKFWTKKAYENTDTSIREELQQNVLTTFTVDRIRYKSLPV